MPSVCHLFLCPVFDGYICRHVTFNNLIEVFLKAQKRSELNSSSIHIASLALSSKAAAINAFDSAETLNVLLPKTFCSRLYRVVLPESGSASI